MALQLERSGNLNFYYAPDSSHGYIDSLDFKVDGETVHWQFLKDTTDICKIILSKKLFPGKSIKITTPFYVKIPGEDFSRLGHYGQSYQVTQWYPKPAVYDNSGWHYFPYLNEGEFYSEFGKFDVSITIPKNYIVAATGVLQNSEEIASIEENAKETSKLLNYNKYDISFPPSSSKHKTLHFVQDSVHDFAWFADKRFHVLKGNVKLPNSGKTVTTWVYFTNLEGNIWKNAINYVNNAVFYYSEWLGEYPYSQCTAVESALGAGGGMEYPMITNIGWSGNSESLEEVIVHEVGHNWLYGILGFNEREHPWMDEGINSYYEQHYITEIAKNAGYYNSFYQLFKLMGIKNLSPFDLNRYACEYIARNGSDQPLDVSSEALLTENYVIIAYLKGAFAMNYLRNYLGEKDFDQCMNVFFEKWKFKHPYPNDLQKVLEDCTGKNLSWFFNGICKTVNYSDYKIKHIKFNKSLNSCELTLKNSGKLISPLNYALFSNGIAVDSAWIDGFSGKKTISLQQDFDKIALDPKQEMFEINRRNNISKKNGILKKTEPLNFQLLGIFENPVKTRICYTPVVGWNSADGWLPGILIYNSFLPEKTCQYRLMPMYGTNSGELAGIAYAEYNFYPYSFGLQKLSLFSNFQQFNSVSQKLYLWQKSDGGIKLLFKRTPQKPKQQWQAVLKTSNIINRYIKSDILLFNVIVQINNHSKLMPYSGELNAEFGPGFSKSWGEYKFQINYKKRGTGFSTRLFAGTFICNKSTEIRNNFKLSGTIGYNDYKFSETFPDRNAGIYDGNLWSHQFISNDGGFGIFTPVQTNAWMTSLNLKAAFPVPVPLSIYFNIATYNNARNAFIGSVTFPYEAGIELRIIPGIFAVYFPITMSKDIKQINDMFTSTYIEKIRFTLNFSKLVPFKYTNELPMMF